jgi:acetylornithine deacetylase/succinyl-diaminopimelate desuccinylase-like protein
MIDSVELLRTLIRNACVNNGHADSGHEHRSVATLAEFFGRPGVIFEPAPGRQSVVYRVPATDPTAPTLMLMGHTDVVPVNPAGWSVDPFGAEVVDGFVWGRGAVDMLNLTASMAAVFEPYLAGRLEPPPGGLVFLAVADEENAGGLGARPLVEDRWDLVACDYLLTEIAYPSIATPSGPAYPVSVGEKGPHWTFLRTTGTPGHGSVPYGADNALAPLVEALSNLFSTPSPVIITDEWRGFVEGLGLDEEQSAELLDADRIDSAIERIAENDPRFAAYVHACTHLTVSPNVISGGVKANMVPEAGEAQIDLRSLPGQTRADVDLHVRKAMGSVGDRVELIPIADHAANSSAMGNPLWETIVDSIEDITGSRRIVPTMMTATTDARFFRARGVTSYGVGLFDDRVAFPDFLSMFHGHDERVSVESVGLTTRLLEQVVDRWTQVS